MRLSKNEIEAHLSVADEALSWLTTAREQFKSYSSFQDYVNNMPELIRFFRRLETTTSGTANNFFSILPEEYAPTPEIGTDYWYNGELICITKIEEPRKNMGKYFFYKKYSEDYIKPSERKEYSSPIRFAGLLLPYNIEPLEDLPSSETVPSVEAVPNYEENIKLCDEIVEECQRIQSAAFWVKQCAVALQSKEYENQSDKIDDNNNHVDYVYKLREFAERLLALTDELIPGSFITDDE